MRNAGDYRHKIRIVRLPSDEDPSGFLTQSKKTEDILITYAKVKTTRGYTLIAANSDFEAAYTNFTIRYPKAIIERDMLILFGGKKYRIEYLNNIDLANIELEIQAKEVTP